MNTNAFNAQVYNATPSFSSASGISILNIGTVTATMGVPIQGRFVQTNYVTTVISNTVYIKPAFINTNYIKG